MKLGRKIQAAFWAVLVTALLATAGSAAADSLLVQPDGKVVVTGKTYPDFGALARLNPDGSLDPSFGQGGFAIDQRTPSFSAVALQSDGRIVGVTGPGSVLSRYLPDGVPDLGFAGDGMGGTSEPGQPYYTGPPALLVQPDGKLVVVGSHSLGGGNYESWVRRYDAGGGLLETMGRVPRQAEPLSSSGLRDLVERPDGSFVGAGWTYGYENSEFRLRHLLVGFLPGSGSDFDPSFGSGAGLVRPDFPQKPRTYSNSFTALAQTGDKVLAAGKTAGTFLVARFDAEGNLDPSFGEGGYAAPPIVGPGDAPSKNAFEEASSGAEDLAVMPDGDIVLAGGTSQWSTEWVMNKMTGLHCTDCPQPLLARFDESGKLDPSFGSGGLLRLLRPDGSTFVGAIQQVTALADGKILVNGFYGRPFVARLNPDGSYDPSFGEGGLVTLRFPCSDQSTAEQRLAGCLPSALLKLRLRGLRKGKPALFLRVAPSLSWGAISGVNLTLPRGVRLARKFKSRLRVTAVGGSGRAKVEVTKPKKKGGKMELFFTGFGEAKELQVKLRRGSLRTFGRHRPRRALRLPMHVLFTDATFRDFFETTQKLTRRVRSAG